MDSLLNLTFVTFYNLFKAAPEIYANGPLFDAGTHTENVNPVFPLALYAVQYLD